ncbi:MAG: hypothetical protein IPP82_02345 [Xanthomonadales bacterium]|nr:hypothetical protein [Xanthomonadales bacterium]
MAISQAISAKHLITFSYDGFMRTVEPHTYGIDGKGHEALRAFQVAGGSNSGEFVGWKLFHISEMGGITVLPTTFHNARHGYKRGDKAFSRIYAQL